MILEKIVFTGIDTYTDVQKLIDIIKTSKIPIEIAFLYSETKKAIRYMELSEILKRNNILQNNRISTAIHLCGIASTNYLKDHTSGLLYSNLKNKVFSTIQCNNIKVLRHELAIKHPKILHIPYNRNILKECNNIITSYNNISILQDRSGGKGISNDFLPPVMNVKNGFAGGIGPDNVVEKLEEINNLVDKYYVTWIDMENNVRTEDKFDLNKIQQVIEKVNNYGKI